MTNRLKQYLQPDDDNDLMAKVRDLVNKMGSVDGTQSMTSVSLLIAQIGDSISDLLHYCLHECGEKDTQFVFAILKDEEKEKLSVGDIMHMRKRLEDLLYGQKLQGSNPAQSSSLSPKPINRLAQYWRTSEVQTDALKKVVPLHPTPDRRLTAKNRLEPYWPTSSPTTEKASHHLHVLDSYFAGVPHLDQQDIDPEIIECFRELRRCIVSFLDDRGIVDRTIVLERYNQMKRAMKFFADILPCEKEWKVLRSAVQSMLETNGYKDGTLHRFIAAVEAELFPKD